MSEATTAAVTARTGLPALIVAMRPYQWPKNLIVFAALIFSAGDAWEPGDFDSWWPLLWRTVALFGLWSLVSSATYLLNDVRDRTTDALHPRKRRRPIASGAVSPRTAITTAILLTVIALPLAAAIDIVAGAVLAGYAVIMAAYSFGLKNVAIMDILILCTGVVGRAVGG
ncbi:MAG TPA: UbiA family prenyltransferase, partial [Tepidiformaceae bacterium]|nr:UbiA family prenyltransferase [Tepidiformaceae bacterium]